MENATYTKRFCEQVFDLLNHNASDVEEGIFRDETYVEYNGDDASIDFYENIDSPHDKDPMYRLLCVDGAKPHPIVLWALWCSNYPPDVDGWMRKVFPENPEHFRNKVLGLLNRYGSDEAMNRFLRELSEHNQRRLIRYVTTEFSC